MFSAFMLDPLHGWIATHRLPLESAIKVCLAHREYHYNCLVAVVPDAIDPSPYLDLAETFRPQFA